MRTNGRGARDLMAQFDKTLATWSKGSGFDPSYDIFFHFATAQVVNLELIFKVQNPQNHEFDSKNSCQRREITHLNFCDS